MFFTRSVTDLIEDYLNMLISDQGGQPVEFTRSSIAIRFDCVPSQINYVLTTRFTPERGFLVESQRGTGGYIRLSRIFVGPSRSLYNFTLEIPDAINQEQASHIIDRLGEENFITPREAKLMTGAIRNTLALVPQEVRHLVRASMLKSMVYEIIRFDQLIEEIVTAENTSKE